MYRNKDEFKRLHRGDIPTLWRIYQSENKFYQNLYFKSSIVLAIVITSLAFYSKLTFYTVLMNITSITLSILPNLLGFNLGAYILIVGFGSTDILTEITEPQENQKNFSLYQVLNGVLGVAVIAQALTLLGAFIVKTIADLQINLLSNVSPSNYICVASAFNVLTLFFILFFTIYSLLLLIIVVKHVFLFAQTIHFFTYITKVDKEEARRAKIEAERKSLKHFIIKKLASLFDKS